MTDFLDFKKGRIRASSQCGGKFPVVHILLKISSRKDNEQGADARVYGNVYHQGLYVCCGTAVKQKGVRQ